jgi:LacI family transcriptional regulator
MSATLNDIARETHTSVSTVSRVLAGGRVAERISAETRARVAKAADRLGYRPNLLARSLRTRKTHTVALLVSDIANPFFGQIASHVERSLHGHGYSLVLCNSGEDLRREDEYLSLLPRKGIDGLVLVPLARDRNDLAAHLPKGLPLVILDRPIPGISASVTSDQAQAADALAGQLRRAGVRRIALASGPGVIFTHHHRVESVAPHFEVVARHEGAAQVETGRDAARAFARGPPFDAVVCTNNFIGQGYLESVELRGDGAIVGVFDAIPMMRLLPVPIVCCVQDVARLAEACVNQLLPQLRGERGAEQLEPITAQTNVVTNPAFDRRVGA